MYKKWTTEPWEITYHQNIIRAAFFALPGTKGRFSIAGLSRMERKEEPFGYLVFSSHKKLMVLLPEV